MHAAGVEGGAPQLQPDRCGPEGGCARASRCLRRGPGGAGSPGCCGQPAGRRWIQVPPPTHVPPGTRCCHRACSHSDVTIRESGTCHCCAMGSTRPGHPQWPTPVFVVCRQAGQAGGQASTSADVSSMDHALEFISETVAEGRVTAASTVIMKLLQWLALGPWRGGKPPPQDQRERQFMALLQHLELRRPNARSAGEFADSQWSHFQACHWMQLKDKFNVNCKQFRAASWSDIALLGTCPHCCPFSPPHGHVAWVPICSPQLPLRQRVLD